MTDQALILVLYSIGALVLYGLLSRGLFRATEGLRFSLIDISAPLLGSETLEEEDKSAINRALSQVHSAFAAWRMVCALVLAIVSLPSKSTHLAVKKFVERIRSDLRSTYSTFIDRWIIAVLGNSPAAALLFVVIIIFVFVFIASALPITYIILKRQSDGRADNSCAHSAAH